MELVEDVNSKQIEDLLGRIESSSETSRPFASTPDDTSIVESFLAGKTCLTGGTGWWKYEFCYGKYVRQYHSDKYGGMSTIMLGTFDENKHKEYLDAHPDKKPKLRSKRKQITHFYTEGSLCDKTGKNRQVEVILKCLENPPTSSAVSLYLVEPKMCTYVLGVESALICSILDRLDEYGLVGDREEDQEEGTSSASSGGRLVSD
jgi:endoplasmic reticulum lectin 1